MDYANIVEQFDGERLLVNVQMRRKIEHRISLRKLVIFFALLSLFGIIYFGYFCSDNRCSLSYNPKPVIYSEWTVMNLLSTNMTGTIFQYELFLYIVIPSIKLKLKFQILKVQKTLAQV